MATPRSTHHRLPPGQSLADLGTTLTPGSVPPRPPRGRSQAHPGVAPLSKFTHRTQRFQPLPPPLGEPPYHMDLEVVVPGIHQDPAAASGIVFHVVGDTGGIKTPGFQRAVAAAMKGDLNNSDPTKVPRFFFHLGDVVYFNGQPSEYYGQFYEPYEHYTPPILSIPGNHDGDPIDDTQTSLDGWVEYFMTPTPHVDPISQDSPQITLSLPNVYWTLDAPFVTIVGMYTNVPEGGSIDSVQQQWLTNELATAPQNKALIVALHHPVYSFDDHHSGSPRMADALQHAINDSRRVPNMVLTAHVHNYQRIERPLVDGAGPTPFLVAGLGGYPHLHGMNADPGTTDPDTQATLVSGVHDRHGYVTLTVTAGTISGVAKTAVATTPDDRPDVEEIDTFSYPAGPITLPAGVVVSL